MCGNSIRVEAHARPLNGRVSSPGAVPPVPPSSSRSASVHCWHFVDEKIHGTLKIIESLLDAR